MQGHVINFDRSLNSFPDDLMTINELCAKYQFKYGYLYKWSVMAKNRGFKHIAPYYFGTLKLSEKEVLEFTRTKPGLKYGGD